MEYVLEELELEAGLKRQLVALQFEALATVHETWANQAKQAAQLLAAETAGAVPGIMPGAEIPPSARDAQNRQAARARQAVVTRWLRQLTSPRP